MVDMVVDRRELRRVIGRLLRLMLKMEPGAPEPIALAPPVPEPEPAGEGPSAEPTVPERTEA